MVERKTTQTLEDPPVYTGSVRNQTTTTAEPATTVESATTAESATTQPDLRPPIQPDPDKQQPSFSLVSQLFRCSILAVGVALIWTAAFSWILSQLPLDSSASSFSRSSFSDMPTEAPDFSFLVVKQAAIVETFADALARLNSPIALNLDGACSNQHGTGCHNAYRDTDDPHGVAATASSRLPLHMTMKMAELAIVDLKVAVRNSRLSDGSKFLLVEHLATFHTATETHSRKLQLLQAKSKGSLDRQVVQNVFLSTELERLQAGELDRQRVRELDRLRVGVLDQILRLIPSVDDSDLQNTNTRRRLQQLYSSAFNEGRKQIRQLILQVQDLQLGLKDMEETRRTILDIMGREQGKQLQLQEDIMAYVWTHLGGHQVEQETYRTNLALLKSINQQSKLTGGGLQWIYLKLIDYEAELKEMWEGMVDAGMVTAEDGGGWGAGGFGETTGGPSSSTPGSANRAAGAGVHKKEGFSWQAEIDEIKRVTIKLKAKWAQANGKAYAQAG